MFDDDRDYHYSSLSEISRHDAMLNGEARPDMAWVSSDWDVMYANPYYSGPPVCHPECPCDHEGPPRPGCWTNPPLPKVPETLVEMTDRVLRKANEPSDDEIPF